MADLPTLTWKKTLPTTISDPGSSWDNTALVALKDNAGGGGSNLTYWEVAYDGTTYGSSAKPYIVFKPKDSPGDQSGATTAQKVANYRVAFCSTTIPPTDAMGNNGQGAVTGGAKFIYIGFWTGVTDDAFDNDWTGNNNPYNTVAGSFSGWICAAPNNKDATKKSHDQVCIYETDESFGVFFNDCDTSSNVSYFSLAGAIIKPFDTGEIDEDPARMWGVIGGSADLSSDEGTASNGGIGKAWLYDTSGTGTVSAPWYQDPIDDGHCSFLYYDETNGTLGTATPSSSWYPIMSYNNNFLKTSAWQTELGSPTSAALTKKNRYLVKFPLNYHEYNSPYAAVGSLRQVYVCPSEAINTTVLTDLLGNKKGYAISASRFSTTESGSCILLMDE